MPVRKIIKLIMKNLKDINFKGSSPAQIKAAYQLYDYIVESAEKSNFLNESADSNIDEGLLSGLLGAAGGALVGPIVGKAICKVLGINESGTLGKLLTSTLVTSAMSYELAK